MRLLPAPDLTSRVGVAMTTFGVSLLSGGLDSTTVTAYARGRVDLLTALTFHYGQSHAKEVDCAQHIAQLLGIEHRLLDASFLGEVGWYSALINPEAFPAPRARPLEEIGFGVPITYVPLRNSIMLTLSAAFLESQVLNAIEQEGLAPALADARLFMAPNALDYSGYPDCRPEFFDEMARALNSGSKLWTQYEVRIRVETPVIRLSKAEIVEMGMRLGAPLEHTWSCYHGRDLPCGECDSCVLRTKGFREAGVVDPLLARLGMA